MRYKGDMARTAEMKHYLKQAYPDGWLPPGKRTEVAEQFGVSGQSVMRMEREVRAEMAYNRRIVEQPREEESMAKDYSKEEIFAIAREQGWSVTQRPSGHWCLRPADRTKPQVMMANSPGDFRAMRSAVSQLRNSGLVLPERDGQVKRGLVMTEMLGDPEAEVPVEPIVEEEAVAQLCSEETPVTPPTTTDISGALDAAIQMIEELANDFVTFRNHATERMVKMDGRLNGFFRDLQRELEKDNHAQTSGYLKDLRTYIDQGIASLREEIEAVRIKADPIGNFRNKLRG